MDIEEVIPFVYKELDIWNSYSSIQGGLLHCSEVKLEVEKKSKSYFLFYPSNSSMKKLHFTSLFEVNDS